MPTTRKAQWSVFCESIELAEECRRATDALGLKVTVTASRAPEEDAARSLTGGHPTALCSMRAPYPRALLRLATSARQGNQKAVLGVVGEADTVTAGLASDLGLVAVDSVEALSSALALCPIASLEPWRTPLGNIPEIDRIRLRKVLEEAPRRSSRLARTPTGALLWKSRTREHVLGGAVHVAAALAAIRAAPPPSQAPVASVGGVERDKVLDVLFGPPRALSDPASKAALTQYDVPLPDEELCTTPSRAAAEAARLGFPVRITLASPDVRIWEQPDLSIDGVDNAARVRSAFGEIRSLALSRSQNARLLGVTVSASTAARAFLRVRMEPMLPDRVDTTVAFSDPHGLATKDETRTLLPISQPRLGTALRRLRAHSLLTLPTSAAAEQADHALFDFLLRTAAFVRDWSAEVESVEINPLCVLIDGRIEPREICITVGDAFVRGLGFTPAGAAHS